MALIEEVKAVLGDTLHLGPRADRLEASSPLLGNVPELDSMAVVSILTAFEDEYGLIIDDDSVTAEIFESIGTLHSFLADLG